MLSLLSIHEAIPGHYLQLNLSNKYSFASPLFISRMFHSIYLGVPRYLSQSSARMSSPRVRFSSVRLRGLTYFPFERLGRVGHSAHDRHGLWQGRLWSPPQPLEVLPPRRTRPRVVNVFFPIAQFCDRRPTRLSTLATTWRA